MKMVQVEWLDACSGNGWNGLADLRDHPATLSGGLPVQTVGYVLKDDVKGITLTQGFSYKNEQGTGLFFIPNGMITKVTELTKKRIKKCLKKKK